jgi:hypothetical protein
MMGLSARIELANVMAVQGLHDADPRKHRWTIRLSDEDQRLDRGLPRGTMLLGFRQLCNVVRGILERDKRLSLRDRNRIIEVGGSGH